MSPLDVSQSIPMAGDAEFDRWLTAHGESKRETVVAIYNKASGKPTVTLGALQETALCHGWVDTQTKRIEGERYAIRFLFRDDPARPGRPRIAESRADCRRKGE